MATLCFLGTGCGTLNYLLQATGGQLALINRAKPISEVLEDEKTPPRVKELLSQIGDIKEFGEENGLKPTPNYTTYTKLDRKAAVWVVSACEKLKFKPKVWKFPIVGSFPYLGWFNLDSAKNYADELKAKGWDVDVRGASAYSTLGWFHDPVLSTMISKGDAAFGDLVNTVIHESVHATVYVNGQSYFNESLANYVAGKLTDVYLFRKYGEKAPRTVAYLKEEKRGDEAEKRLHEAYEELSRIYSSAAPDSEKLDEKNKILANLMAELHLKRPINNATLIQYKTYNTGEEAFEALYLSCGKTWPCFIQRMKELTPRSFAKMQEEDFSPTVRGLAR